MVGFNLSFSELTPLERLRKAKIQIQQKNSFFGQLSIYVKYQEVKDDFMEMPCGIDSKGNFYYKIDFIKSLSDNEIEGLVIHEILHLGLLHLLRRRNRPMEVWNIANDLIVNNIAKNNGYSLPEGGLIPYNNEFKIGHVTITNIDKKTSEEVYDEIPIEYIEGGEGGGKYKRWDEHQESENKTPEEIKEEEEEWSSRILEAATNSQMKGDLPRGMANLIKGLHKSEIGWRTILQRFIQSHIPYDYTYSTPSKKSVSAGFYMPNNLKEKIKVAVVVDMSGSIGQKETADFMSEIIGIAKAYKDRIEMILLTHDTDVQDEYVLENGVAEKAKKLVLHGGGGTSHVQVLDRLKEKHADTKVAIFLTDGYSDLETINLYKYDFKKLFVLNKNGNQDLKLKGGIILKLKN